MPKKSDEKKEKKSEEIPKVESKVTKSFINILAILSILGFVGIVSSTLFNRPIETYIESLWFILMGIGFLFESHPIRLLSTIRIKFKEQNFTALTTLVIGALALIAGILTLPQIAIENPALESIKGVISIIAILFIIVQTWIIKQ
jgi:hypothetical protein